MTNPAPIKGALDVLARRLPLDTLRAMEQESADREETPEQAAGRLQAADTHRHSRWERRLPDRYRTAGLGQLTEDQHGYAIAGWWPSSSLTLLLVGPPGLGKTHAAYAVGRAAVGVSHVWGECWTATALMIALRPGGDPSVRDDALYCDLLVLDDLGRENNSGWTVEQLHHLLDVRVAEKRRTVITTNLTADQITARYGSAFFDRLIDGTTILRFEGESRRRKAEW